MFTRKLSALNYPGVDSLKTNNLDDKQFRSIVLWLEDQKIRHYTIQDREKLRNLQANDWDQAYQKYKKDIICPITSNNRNEELSWFLSYAIQLDFSDNKDKYQKKQDSNKQNVPSVVATNPLDNLDFDSPDFKNGVNALAKILKIAPHPNHKITLQAVRKVVCARLNAEALENPQSVIVKGAPFPYQEANLGFDLGDRVHNEAAKILRLIYIQNLRQLQTKANELIVAVQNITANPKTDTKLGKVGI